MSTGEPRGLKAKKLTVTAHWVADKELPAAEQSRFLRHKGAPLVTCCCCLHTAGALQALVAHPAVPQQ
jgi:hypothetical protein